MPALGCRSVIILCAWMSERSHLMSSIMFSIRVHMLQQRVGPNACALVCAHLHFWLRCDLGDTTYAERACVSMCACLSLCVCVCVRAWLRARERAFERMCVRISMRASVCLSVRLRVQEGGSWWDCTLPSKVEL
eukprot:3052671-Pleurochrysis_carterae.AAC.9